MKVRFRFSKLGKVRWTSHRDVARMWERAFRRVELPLAYTQGFSPRPRVSFGLALPTGGESVAEYLDADVDPARVGAFDVSALPDRLSPALPVGIDVVAAALIDDRAPSLQADVSACRWEVDLRDTTVAALSPLASQLLETASVVVTRERKGQQVTDDIRPAILALDVLGPVDEGGGSRLACELATKPRGVRPAELLAALGPGLEAVRLCRTHQWISRDGAREEPLPFRATDAPHALERAS